MFAIIFFRLWFLQVLSGDKYLAEANNNQVRDVVVPAPRGDIVDRNGECWSTTACRSPSSSSPTSCRRPARSATSC